MRSCEDSSVRKLHFLGDLLVILSLLLLGGCQTISDSSVGEKREGFVSFSDYKAMGDLESSPLLLNETELNLQLACEIALKAHPSLETVAQSLEASKSSYLKALSSYRPNISVNADWGYEDTAYGSGSSGTLASYPEAVTQTQGLELTLHYLLFDGFARSAQKLRAQENVLSHQANFRDARRILLQQVKHSWYRIQLNRLQLQIAEENLRFMEDRLQETRLQFEKGIIAETVYLNFSARTNDARVVVLGCETDCQLSKVYLAKWMGFKDGQLPRQMQLPDPALPDYQDHKEAVASVESYLDLAYENRPDLEQLRHQERSFLADLESAKGQRWPRFFLQGGLGVRQYSQEYAGQGGNTETDLDLSSQQVGVTANWDVYSGGYQSADIREKRALHQQQRAQLERSWLEAMQEVQVAHVSLQQAIDLWDIYGKQLESYQRRRDLTLLQFNAGTVSLSDFNSAQLDYIQALNRRADAYSRIQNAWADLECAVGVESIEKGTN